MFLLSGPFLSSSLSPSCSFVLTLSGNGKQLKPDLRHKSLGTIKRRTQKEAKEQSLGCECGAGGKRMCLYGKLPVHLKPGDLS